MGCQRVFFRRLFQWLLFEQRLQESTASIPWHTTKAPAWLTAPHQWKIPESTGKYTSLEWTWSQHCSQLIFLLIQKFSWNKCLCSPAWGCTSFPPHCWKHLSYPGDTWPWCIFCDPKGEMSLLKGISAVAAALEVSPLQTQQDLCASQASHIPLLELSPPQWGIQSIQTSFSFPSEAKCTILGMDGLTQSEVI